MKVYSCPTEVPAPELDFTNFDFKAYGARIERHQADLKAHLIKLGYTGKNTGGVASFGVADGAAQYMLAEGSKSCLIHLPYGDAYHYRDVGFLPKAEILKRIKQAKSVAAIFAKKVA